MSTDTRYQQIAQSPDAIPAAPMILEINFGKGGKSGEILVYPGDDPQQLAVEFAAKHNIKEKAIPLIKSHIQGYLDDLNSQSAPPASRSPASPLVPEPVKEQAQMTAEERIKARIEGQKLAAATVAASNSTPLPANSTTSHDTSTVTANRADSSTSVRLDEENSGGLVNVQLSFGAQSPVELSPIGRPNEPSQLHSPPPSPSKSTVGADMDAEWTPTKSIPSPYSPPSPNPAAATNEAMPTRSISYPESSKEISSSKPMASTPSPSSPTRCSSMPSSLHSSTAASASASSFSAAATAAAATKPTASASSSTFLREKEKEKEDVYYHLKDAWSSRGRESIDADSTQMSSLAPTATTMNTTRQPLQNGGQRTNAPITERLYHNAKMAARQRDKLKQDADQLLAKELQDARFRISHESRRLCQSKVLITQAPNILARLYQEGLKEMEDRKKAPEALPVYIDDWSCASCGTFYTTRKTFEGAMSSKAGLKCAKCGFEQSRAAPHQPVMFMASRMSHQDKAEMLRRAHERNIMKTHRQNAHKASLQPSFKPAIPESSKRIVETHIKKEREQAGEGHKLDSHRIHSGDEGSGRELIDAENLDDAVRDAGGIVSDEGQEIKGGGQRAVPLGEYLNKDIYARLCENKKPTARKTTYLPLSFAEIMGEDERKDANLPNEIKSEPLDPVDLARLLNRLTYEYKEKDARRAHELSRPPLDPVTGAPLFQPQLPSSKGGSYGITYHHAAETADKRYLRDRMSQASKEKMTLQQIKAVDDLVVQCKPLPRSEQILEEATSKSIEVMFRVLLAGTLMPTPSPNGPPLAGANPATVSPGGNISLLLKHDHEDWSRQSLDLSKLRTDILVPEMVDLVAAVSAELTKLNDALPASPRSSLTASFDLFSKLVRKCLRQRETTGLLQWRRNFVVTPRSRRVTPATPSSDDEETFHPKVDPKSSALVAARNRGQGMPVHELLFDEGKKLLQRQEEAARQHELREADRANTKPVMYPAPPGVVPRYRHVKKPPPAAPSTRASVPKPAPRPVVKKAPTLPPPPPAPLAMDSKNVPPPLPCEMMQRKDSENSSTARQLFTPE